MVAPIKKYKYTPRQRLSYASASSCLRLNPIISLTLPLELNYNELSITSWVPSYSEVTIVVWTRCLFGEGVHHTLTICRGYVVALSLRVAHPLSLQ